MAPTNPSSTRAQPPKKPYRRPELSVYGDVRHLTGGAAGMGSDSGSTTMMAMMAMNMCWIAEALYGPGTPRVALLRAWLARSHARGTRWARVLVPLYQRHGRRIAAALPYLPPLKAALRPLFDAGLRAALRDQAARQARRRRAR